MAASQKWGAERAALVYRQQQEVIALQQEYYALFNTFQPIYTTAKDKSKQLVQHTQKDPSTPAKLDIYQLHSDILRVAAAAN